MGEEIEIVGEIEVGLEPEDDLGVETGDPSPDLSVISYHDKNLEQWTEFLTIKIPNLPASSLAINQTIASLNDRYQDAYNCYNELMVMCSSLKRKFDVLLNQAKQDVINDLTKKGVKRAAVATVESLALNKKKVKQQNEILKQHEVVKTFFENHKNKLEKVMHLVSGLQYSTNQSDKMYNRTSGTGGLP